ncbi:MAG: phytanoyl-CoA dioxygenase family protein [Planctomycetes bacterium]|nr:phytanoyl-CoA dioxygenase family protein [Planctomycetota bacterium]
MMIVDVPPDTNEARSMLAALGVAEDALGHPIALALDRDGYALIPGFLDAAAVERYRDAYEAVIRAEGAQAGIDHHQEAGARRVGNLVNKGPVWYPLWTDPRLLAAAWHVLRRDFKLGAMSGRDPLQGHGHQDYHLDCAQRADARSPYQAFSAMILLDDFTLDNGCTRLVPGSHVLVTTPASLPDPAGSAPDEITLLAPAGTAFLFNAHLWHAGNTNRAGSIRRLVHVFYQGREVAQWLDQRKHIRPETLAAIPDAARRLLDC